ncbi:MAG: sigma-70 family RNA polymerase sigma factor [Firmicutes bacterium]|nr:sigma-70 family RNA polymerase sigma factor [Bacillota bacterium]
MPAKGIPFALVGHPEEAVAKAVDEQTLVREAQAGDRLAFEALVRRYDRDVLRLALNLVRHAEEARDIYQEAFLKAYKNLHRFRFECSFYTWLYRIVTNVCLDHLRRRACRPEDPSPNPRLVEPARDNAREDFFDRQIEHRAQANPERSLLGKQLGEQIAAALADLSPRERFVFEMRHWEGLRLRTIAELLGTTEETVKNSLFRATRKLRSRLEAWR